MDPTRRAFGLSVCGLSLYAQAPNAKRGTIRHFGGITAQTMANLATAVDVYINKGLTQITLNISSPGGETAAAISAYQYLKGRPIDLTTHNFGTVDSAAVIVFAAGAQRHCTPLSRFAIHGPSSVVPGASRLSEVDLSEQLSLVKQETNIIATILSESTGKALSTATAWIRDRVVWTAQQALEYNFIHKITSDIQSVNAAASIVGPSLEDLRKTDASR